jgi:D-alanyl-lipoteichoic acid acyltransferase DltB (MBOAT superfamily)
MLFNSIEFAIFFPIVVSFYFLMPHRYRWAFLLLASSVFYMAFIPAYLAVIAIIVLIGYIAGLIIEKARGTGRKCALAAGIALTCSVLIAFKYLPFFEDSLAAVARFFSWHYSPHVLRIILPLGLSFNSFQSMGYLIEVYRGRQKAERHPGYYALFVMFFPQLVAGPIGRSQQLLHQFRERHEFSYVMATNGLKLMVWGLFKKVVVADRLGLLVTTVFATPREHTGPSLALATICFAFQIYCDFSGYSDIAIGSAQVMGFSLMENFRTPYHASSVVEFWRRWHISLSTWFRDYLYIPLGGNKVSGPRWCANIMITFLVSGLWHGANWTFVGWGALHGLYYLASRWTAGLRQAICRLLFLHRFPLLHKGLQVLITFLLVSFAWIFFVSRTFEDALYVVSHLFAGYGSIIKPGYVKDLLTMARLGLDHVQLGIAVMAILFVEIVSVIEKPEGMRTMFSDRSPLFRWSFYYGITMGTLLFGVFDNMKAFIYFKF